MKTINIQGRNFSKIICGTNPFYGHSHFSEARNTEYLNRFTDDYITEMIQFCLSKGINTVESCANERIVEIISAVKRESPLRFIGTTRLDETSPMKSHQQKLGFLLEHQADICVIHAQFVDRPRSADDIHGLQRLIEQVHQQNVLVGISTHRISTVELCERKQYGVDLYLFPFNLSGYVYPGYEGQETVEARRQLILQTPKPFVLMKVLASGRIPPQEGLAFVLDNSKPNDLITLGMGSLGEAEECLSIIGKHMEKTVSEEK